MNKHLLSTTVVLLGVASAAAVLPRVDLDAARRAIANEAEVSPAEMTNESAVAAVSYTHLTLPTNSLV